MNVRILSPISPKRLTQDGFGHVLLALACLVSVGVVGTALIVSSHTAETTITKKIEPSQAQASSLANTSTPVPCTLSGATGAGLSSYIVSVGALANGGDSTSAINGAIITVSSHGGGTVRLQPGIYVVNGHIILKNNVALSGAGMFATVIQAGPKFMNTSDDGGYPVIATDSAKNVTIENLGVDQGADHLYRARSVNEYTTGRLTAYVVNVFNSSNVIVQHVAVRNQFTYSLVANASTKFCFRNDNVEQNPAVNGEFDQLDGIHILNSSYGDILGNYVDQRFNGATDGDDGLVAHAIGNASEHDLNFSGNVVRGGSKGDDMQIVPGGKIYNIKISNNEFYGGPFGIRTGIYGPGINNMANITISGNNLHNNQPGYAYPNGGEAIDIGGLELGGRLKSANGIVIENNKQCQSTDSGVDGAFYVQVGLGNLLTNNTTYAGCVDTPGSNPASN